MAKNLTGTGYFISKKIGRAICDYGMIKEGDKVMVAVSGGKDSLTLLNMLNERRKWSPVKYHLIAVHVESDFRCGACGHVDRLEEYFKEKGVEYYVEKVNILKNPDGSTNDMNCFWCSWCRRKGLFNLAAKLKCNKIAFGHHRDDIVQTTLMNIFFLSEISTMAPKIGMFDGELDIIRPMAYVEEKEIVRYAKKENLPVKNCQCPYGSKSQRRNVKEIINGLEKVCPQVKSNIFNSLKRIKKDHLI